MIRAAVLSLALTLAAACAATAQTPATAAGVTPAPRAASKWPVYEQDILLKDFRFHSGEVFPALKVHVLTLGQPRRDAKGRVTNAVMALHGTGGRGSSLLNPVFADVLFKPGGQLDIARWYVILPDGLGHGGSSKPSDGLHVAFPHYDYADMVEAQHRMLTEGLKVDHLRLLMGTSMGCMHDFVWGETYPGFATAIMPLACLPVPIAGRNRMWRQAVIDAIQADPDWRGGEYRSPPKAGLRTAADLLLIAGATPLPFQNAYPTPEKAEAYLRSYVERSIATTDANDLIYAVDASRDYDPSAGLEKITVPVTWINSSDDFINPPELGVAEAMSKRLKNGRFVLIPFGPNTHGHGTHTWASIWEGDLKALIERSGGQP